MDMIGEGGVKYGIREIGDLVLDRDPGREGRVNLLPDSCGHASERKVTLIVLLDLPFKGQILHFHGEKKGPKKSGHEIPGWDSREPLRGQVKGDLFIAKDSRRISQSDGVVKVIMGEKDMDMPGVRKELWRLEKASHPGTGVQKNDRIVHRDQVASGLSVMGGEPPGGPQT